MSFSIDPRRATQLLVGVLVACMTASSALAGVSQQRPRFRTEVEIVQLQVQVADSTGRHIPNLESDDIALRVDGDLRDVVALYEVDLSRVADEESRDDTYVPPAGWRQFLLFFDFSFSTKAGILRAQKAARNFVREQTHPRDLIGVATYSAVGGLKLVSPFTADRSQVLDALGTFGLSQSDNIIDPAGFSVRPLRDMLEMEQQSADNAGEIGSEANPGAIGGLSGAVLNELFAVSFATDADDFRRYREQVINYADQLVQLGELLQASQGRKHVLLFSAGFDDEAITGQSLDELSEDNQRINTQGALGLASVNSETRFGSIDLRDSLKKAVRNFNHADVVFHAFDVGGLGNERRDDTFARTRSGKQGLSYIADATDGTIHWNTNDLAPNLARVAEQTSRFYVVAYRKLPEDPPVVDIDVEVLRPGARVVAAPTRFAPPPEYTAMNDAQRQLQLAEFVAKGIEEEELTFDIRAVPFAGQGQISRVAVILEVPYQQLRKLADGGQDGVAQLDLMGYVLDMDGQMRDLFNRRVTLDVDGLSERMAGLPFRYYDLLWSVPGKHRVRVLIRDDEMGMLSTRTVDLDVPEYGSSGDILVSGPIAVDADHPGLLMRGLDPADLPERRQGGPVAYPFMLGDQEVTPQVYTVAEPGQRLHVMMVSYNVAKHPFTGQTHMSLEARMVDEAGGEHGVDQLGLAGRHYDAESDGTTMVVEVGLPQSLSPGAYLMELDLVDGVAGKTVQRVLPLLIIGGETAARN